MVEESSLELFNTDGSMVRRQELPGSHVLYHVTRMDLIPFIAKYGFYNRIGYSTFQPSIPFGWIEAWAGSELAPGVAAFEAREDEIQLTEKGRSYYGLSQATLVREVNPDLITELEAAGLGSWADGIRDTIRVGKLGRISIDPKETLRVNLIASFCSGRENVLFRQLSPEEQRQKVLEKRAKLSQSIFGDNQEN